MHAALLYTLTGDGDRLASDLAGGLPAADVSGTSYLDGRTIYDGTLAGRIAEETPSAVVNEDGIAEATTEREREVLADIYADPEGGWAGVDSADGEELLLGYLRTHGLRAEPAVLDLDAVASALPEDADHKGIVYSQSVDEGHAQDRAGAKWHDDASTGLIPAEGVAGLSISYLWDGIHVDAVLYASGYIAVYKNWTTDQFARWVAEEITPFLQIEREAELQRELPSDDACADCGRESDDLATHAEAPVEGVLCPVCRDKYDEAAGGMSA